ncbi:MAG: type II secretion system F family protein [Actinomycetota bacterium]|nr:type II secretion system F family protein [Actinomycetota bacterium]
MATATVFKWSGKNRTGLVESGEITAISKDEVAAQLKRRSIVPTSITEKKKKKAGGLSAVSFGGSKVKDKDVVIFTRQFSTMIDAGLPLVQALEILASQATNKAFANILTQIKNDVEGGATFADSLMKHPRTFSDLYANMVAAGEAGGILDTVLNRLAIYMEKSIKLKSKVKGAMIYPAVVTCVAALVITVIMVYVVPTFSSMFIQLGGNLPTPTKIVIALSHFIGGKGGLAILVAGVFASIGFVQYRRTEGGKYVTDAIFLKLPIFGILLVKVAVAKFTRTLGTLVSSGVPILEGLDITGKTSGNKVVEKAVAAVKTAVQEGKTLAEPLGKEKVFPDMVTQMIAVGESAGALDTMLNKIADFYDEEVDAAVSGLTSMIEPLMMVFLGGSVGFIVVAMYLPIFKLMSLVANH